MAKIEFRDLTECNWIQASAIERSPEQSGYVTSGTEILALAYIGRDKNANCQAIYIREEMVGLMLVEELNEESCCYHLREFLIDVKHQHKGYGSAALATLLQALRNDKKALRVEVCVHEKNEPAIKFYVKNGFIRSDYVDETRPWNIVYVYQFSMQLIQERIRVEPVYNKDEKSVIVAQILGDLPEWFGLPGSTSSYIEDSRDLPFWVARDRKTVVGFVTLSVASEDCGDVHCMGIKKSYQRQGIGRKLLDALVKKASEQYAYLQVKTVAEGHYKEYDQTIAFYRNYGFKKLEVFPNLWDEWNPCLIMIMKLIENNQSNRRSLCGAPTGK